MEIFSEMAETKESQYRRFSAVHDGLFGILLCQPVSAPQSVSCYCIHIYCALFAENSFHLVGSDILDFFLFVHTYDNSVDLYLGYCILTTILVIMHKLLCL